MPDLWVTTTAKDWGQWSTWTGRKSIIPFYYKVSLKDFNISFWVGEYFFNKFSMIGFYIKKRITE